MTISANHAPTRMEERYRSPMKTAALAVAVAVAALAPLGVAPTADASPTDPSTVTCADIGGVFVAHGTDGRGDCMSADPRHKCHIPPSEQDAFDPTGNYVAEVIMSPPFPGGMIEQYEIESLKSASNADCWKIPS